MLWLSSGSLGFRCGGVIENKFGDLSQLVLHERAFVEQVADFRVGPPLAEPVQRFTVGEPRRNCVPFSRLAAKIVEHVHVTLELLFLWDFKEGFKIDR